MEKNIKTNQNSFISEEEKTLNWEEIQTSFKKYLEVKFIIVGYKSYSSKGI